ncbi:hypothetical protein SKAU_G00248260 [Synaphobranchus kaupii]|uniref:Uncharacterized protein n=1 Tax=Synaphobranchus kaupii TaxID=118154 RepID=A0A9Q1F2F0_SYNKA|nr:hypothetical protein SKAU_G00248260 [Synaphobranchus kaupii]
MHASFMFCCAKGHIISKDYKCGDALIQLESSLLIHIHSNEVKVRILRHIMNCQSVLPVQVQAGGVLVTAPDRLRTFQTVSNHRIRALTVCRPTRKPWSRRARRLLNHPPPRARSSQSRLRGEGGVTAPPRAPQGLPPSPAGVLLQISCLS